MGTIKSLVAAAVLGMMAGCACGGAPATDPHAQAGPPPAPGVATASEKHGCGSHEGAGCGAVEAQPK
jgi:hypothetical protein